jgi:hypothetical protein
LPSPSSPAPETLQRPDALGQAGGMFVDALRLATYSVAMPLPRGFVPPCLPTKAPQPPGVHEIRYDGAPRRLRQA